MIKEINVAIDGPSGSGKGTTAKELSKRLELKYLDTGAMYRALAYHLDKKGKTTETFSPIDLESVEITFDGEGRVYLNGEDVEDQIRTPRITKLASDFSALPDIRESLVAKQKNTVSNGGYVAEGRDIGTVVMPDASVKIYLTASIEERARRRLKDFEDTGEETSLEEVKMAVEERDLQDMNRKHSPLTKPSDAIEVDTSDMAIEEQVERVEDIIRKEL